MTTDDVLQRKTVSVNQACELLGISRRSAYNWMEAGKVEWFRTAGNTRRIFVDSLWKHPSDEQIRAREDDEVFEGGC